MNDFTKNYVSQSRFGLIARKDSLFNNLNSKNQEE
jgi:hypothetical protein